MNTTIEILILLFLILINGFLAMSELAVVSARKARLKLRAAEGNPGYQAALELAENPGRFLSTVQIFSAFLLCINTEITLNLGLP